MTYLLALSSLLSRLIGVYRNFLFSTTFGAGIASDAYFAAFQIPDTIYRLFVFGAISASFVPLFLREYKKDENAAWEFLSSVMNAFLIAVAVLSLLIFFFSRELTELLYPNFSDEAIRMTENLLRIMILSPLLFTLSSLFSGVQNAFRSFLGFALAPILYNIGIIFGIVVFSRSMGISGVAVGVILGALLHVVVQVIPSLRLGLRWKPIITWSRAFKELFITAFPRIFTMAGAQIMFFIEGLIATSLLMGDMTLLRLAQDLGSFPIGIIGVSMAISSFSVLSHFVLDEKRELMGKYIENKFDHLLILMIPAAFGLYSLRVPITTLTLQGGNFGPEEVRSTAEIVKYLCFSIPFSGLLPFLSRVFFSFHDTKRPFYIVLLSVIVNVVLAFVLSELMGVSGIALASSLTAFLACVLMLISLKMRYFPSIRFFSLPHLLTFTIGAFVMSMVIERVLSVRPLDGFAALLFGSLWLTLLGAVIYFAVLFLFHGKKLVRLLKELHT